MIKACRVHRFGRPGVITLEDIKGPSRSRARSSSRSRQPELDPGRPDPGRQERPAAAANSRFGPVGIVEAVGVSVTTFEPGDQVFGVTNPRFTGAYAVQLARRGGLRVIATASSPDLA
jgi:hypothetical protein